MGKHTEIYQKPGEVAHACKSSYLGGGDWEDQGLRLVRPSHNKVGCGGAHM
jgi:hypothetical protein